MYLQQIIVEGFLIAAQFTTRGLLERGYRPQLTGVCRIGPEPFAWPENLIMLFEGAGAMKGPGIMNAAGMTNGIVCNHKIMGEDDKLIKE